MWTDDGGMRVGVEGIAQYSAYAVPGVGGRGGGGDHVRAINLQGGVWSHEGTVTHRGSGPWVTYALDVVALLISLIQRVNDGMTFAKAGKQITMLAVCEHTLNHTHITPSQCYTITPSHVMYRL